MSFGDRWFSGAVVLVMTAVLITLALLQYRWSNEVSRATSERMEVDLETTMMRWRDDLYREIAGFCLRLQVQPAAPSRERRRQYAQQYASWTRVAAHPFVVRNVYLLEHQDAFNSRLLHLDAAKGEFTATAWPAGYGRLRERIQSISEDLAVAATHFKSPQELRGAVPDRHGAESKSDDLARQFPVMVDQDVPALVQPVYRTLVDKKLHAGPSVIDWVIVELDSKALRDHILPELVTRYFGTSKRSTYEVAVMGGPEQHSLIYTSDPRFPRNGGAEPDENLRVFGAPYGPTLRGIDMILLPTYHTQTPDGKFHETSDLASAWPVRIEPIHYSADDDDWHLLARHRDGSLDAAVAGMRRRDLIISFAVLLLLAASMIMLFVSSRRAQALARLQMEFVAGVSHELRTPLAVICSAADNMADGLVASRQQMQQYGNAIRKSARQLVHLVEQVLMFAATRNDRYRYNLALVEISGIVQDACANTAEIIQAAGVTMECRIDPGLPVVMGDRAALAHCLQNLITNAVKYGGEQRWVGIHAALSECDGKRRQVEIAVQDRGSGIPPAELRHVFEPFFRSSAVIAAQIRGTGLGLSIARSISEGMGGRLTVESEPGKGSTFVLHLPVAKAPAAGTVDAVREGAKA